MTEPRSKPQMSAEYVAHLEAEVERLRLALIEAQNPGIDMDEVRRLRAEPPRPRPKLPDPILREE